MNKFDSQVQLLNNRIFKTIARYHWEEKLQEKLLDIPKELIPGKIPTMRCCVYKERAILAERVRIAISPNKGIDENVISVIDFACDECPISGFEVTSLCRGCLAHHCQNACRKNAIYLDDRHTAHIDKTKCVNCGMCASKCPYGAIIDRKRPCQTACKTKAVSVSEDGSAFLDNDKCVSCGQCKFQCPFGAMVSKSYILDAIDIVKGSKDNTEYNVYAMVAPAIASQFSTNLNKVVTAIKMLGFYDVVEAAMGADIVAYEEAKELVTKGFLMNSCCPAFVKFVKNEFPDLIPYISDCLSPMATAGKIIKEKDPTAKIIFIGPCDAKKQEIKQDEVKKYIDCVLTFEELNAIFDSKELDIDSLEETELKDASGFGRRFASNGGVANAVKRVLDELEIPEFEVEPVVCNGLEECRTALLQKRNGKLNGNYIEGMACPNGCIGGPGCLKHLPNGKNLLNAHADKSRYSNIKDVVIENITD